MKTVFASRRIAMRLSLFDRVTSAQSAPEQRMRTISQ
jgi:hypothetical protein